MKILLMVLLLMFAVSDSYGQSRKIKLVKANISNPAQYLRDLKAQGKLTIHDVPTVNEPYDFEKKNDYKFATVGKVKAQKDLMYEAANDRPTIKERPELRADATFVINTDLRDTGGPDPMIAVGEKVVAVSNTSWIRFYDKETGQRLFSTSATGLFERFLSLTINGAPNPEAASHSYDIPVDLPYWCSKSGPCEVDTVEKDPVTNLNVPCPEVFDEGLIQRAYDSRVFYQKEHKRFVIVSALRNESSRDNNYYNEDGSRDCSQYLIRLVGIAVSISEDPNDGFHLYRTGENNYRDWPNAVMDKDYIILSNKSGDAKSNGKSIVTVYNFNQMKDGIGPTIDGFSILQNDAQQTPQTVVPISNFLTNHMSEAFFFIQNKGTGAGKAKFWYFKKPQNPATIFQNPPAALSFAGELNISGADLLTGGNPGFVYYQNAIHMTTHQRFENASSTKKSQFGINYFMVPVRKLNNGTFQISQSQNSGFVHQAFYHDDYSYYNPSLGIDAFNNLVMQFIRVNRAKNTSSMPEIRFKVKFIQDAAWRSSELAQRWGEHEDVQKVDESSEVVDYSWVAKDPYKLGLFWLAHKLQTPGNSGTHIEKVDLGRY